MPAEPTQTINYTGMQQYIDEVQALLAPHRQKKKDSQKFANKVAAVVQRAYHLTRINNEQPFMPAFSAEWVSLFYNDGNLAKKFIFNPRPVFFPDKLKEVVAKKAMIFKEDPEKDITVENLSQADVSQKRLRSSASPVASASSGRVSGGSAGPAVSASTSASPVASASSQQKSGGSAGPAVSASTSTGPGAGLIASASSQRKSGGSAGPAVSAIPITSAAAGPATGSQSSAIPITIAAAGQRAGPVASASSGRVSGGSASQVAGAYTEAGAIPVASASSGRVSGGSASQVASTKSSTSSSTSSRRGSGDNTGPVAGARTSASPEETRSNARSSTSSGRGSGDSTGPAKTRSSVTEFEGGQSVEKLSIGNMSFESPRRQSNDSNESFSSPVIRTNRRETLLDVPEYNSDPEPVPILSPPKPSPQPPHQGNNEKIIRKVNEISSEFSNTDDNKSILNYLESDDNEYSLSYSPQNNRYSLPFTRPLLAVYSTKPAQAPPKLSIIPEVAPNSPRVATASGNILKTNIKFKKNLKSPFFVNGQCLPFENTKNLNENNLNKILNNKNVQKLIFDYNKKNSRQNAQIDFNIVKFDYKSKCLALKKLYTEYKNDFEEIFNQIKFTKNS